MKLNTKRLRLDANYAPPARLFSPTAGRTQDDSLGRDFAERAASPRLPRFPADLPWLNELAMSIAERRYKNANDRRLPYVLARQFFGDRFFVLDGSHLRSSAGDDEALPLMTGPHRCLWSRDEDRTEYLAYLPGRDLPVSVGTTAQLLARGLSHNDAVRLLSVDNFENDEIDCKKEWLFQVRVTYYLLLTVGHVLPKDPVLAASLLAPMADEEIKNTVADIMVMSAGTSFPIFLEAILLLGYDPARGSKRLGGRTASQHARQNGCAESLMILGRYTVRHRTSVEDFFPLSEPLW